MARYVPTQFRTHPLSYMKGGCTIRIIKMTGEETDYDKVKYPLDYITAALLNDKDIVTIHLDGKPVWTKDINGDIKWNLSKEEPKKRKLVPLAAYKMAA